MQRMGRPIERPRSVSKRPEDAVVAKRLAPARGVATALALGSLGWGLLLGLVLVARSLASG